MTIDHRLTTRQMAEFVANGFIRFDAIVPCEVNEPGIEELRRLERERFAPDGLEPLPAGTPLVECSPATAAIGDDLRTPEIRGIIESFVGPNPTFDHDFTHIRPHADVEALRDGWMLLQSSQLTAPLPDSEHLNDHLEHEFVFERRTDVS